jgi:hypothetical protein
MPDKEKPFFPVITYSCMNSIRNKVRRFGVSHVVKPGTLEAIRRLKPWLTVNNLITPHKKRYY